MAAVRRRQTLRYALGTGTLLLGAAAGAAAGRRLAPQSKIAGMVVGGVAGVAASFGALAAYAIMNMGN
jgi:hypothetical protein